MRQYRIIVSDGQRESEIVGEYASMQAARDDAKARGFADIRSIAEMAGDATRPAAPASSPSTPPLQPSGRIHAEPMADGQWMILDQADAERHPLYGVGGWLVLLAVLLILGTVLIGISAIVVFAGGGGGVIVGAILLLLALLQVWLIALLFNRNPIFPTAFLILTGISVGLTVLGLLLDSRGAIRDLVSLAVSTIWMIYVLVSVRVNVTFKRRVKPGDPFLEGVSERQP